VAATYEDYAWLEQDYNVLLETGYCLTWVRGHGAESLLAGLGAIPKGVVTGMNDLSDLNQDSYSYPGPMTHLLVGTTTVGDWALMVEGNGFIGITSALMLPLSRGGEVVAWFTNVNAQERFMWWVDGEQRLELEPNVGYVREELSPELRAQIVATGIDLDVDEDSEFFAYRTMEAAFALAERLTGIRITPELLGETEFLTAEVALPR
jgi:hypothetical protein